MLGFASLSDTRGLDGSCCRERHRDWWRKHASARRALSEACPSRSSTQNAGTPRHGALAPLTHTSSRHRVGAGQHTVSSKRRRLSHRPGTRCGPRRLRNAALGACRAPPLMSAQTTLRPATRVATPMPCNAAGAHRLSTNCSLVTHQRSKCCQSDDTPWPSMSSPTGPEELE